ncbi:MAG TPA: GntR family transcriptional regulator [Dongiaceae bacterium]|nr:GntR family transcriptional regulator [Dongiaceae bacterium]
MPASRHPSAARQKPSAKADAGNNPRIPLWAQVKSSIVKMIADQGLDKHAQLPTEYELCDQFGVSRTVVREAMNQLVVDRIIYKIQGKGAFVADNIEEQNFVGMAMGFTGELIEQHKHINRSVLQQGLATPNARAQRLLRLGQSDQVVEIRRIIGAEGIPRILVHTSLVASLVPGLEQVSLQHRSLHDTLRRRYGIVFRQADRWLKSVLPSDEEASLLEIGLDEPVLAIESCAYLADGTPAEYYWALYRTDQARLHLKIK